MQINWGALGALVGCLGLLFTGATFFRGIMRANTDAIVGSIDKLGTKLDTHVSHFEQHVRDDIEIQTKHTARINELFRYVSKNDDAA